MAAVPKKKISKSRARIRSGKQKYISKNIVKCKNCGSLKLAHTICSNCGYYKQKSFLQRKEEVKVTKVEKDER